MTEAIMEALLVLVSFGGGGLLTLLFIWLYGRINR